MNEDLLIGAASVAYFKMDKTIILSVRRCFYTREHFFQFLVLGK